MPYSTAPAIRGGCNFVSWDQAFFDPVVLPGGRRMVTLRDAAKYITKLPILL
jgi:hypothetical protein